MGSDFRSGNKENNNPKKAQTKKSVPSKPSPAPAKITQPRLIENVYLRKRLFSVLNNALKKPVIWITAQGGAGKTTLITSYLKEKKLPCLWYQIDSGDGDIASFFHYMGIAARYTAPRYKESLPHLTPEYLGGLPVFTRNYFRELYSRLSPHFKNNPPVSPFKKGRIDSSVPSFSKGGLGRIINSSFAIVFDNYQDAPADSSLHEIIQAGLSEIPDGINVIIISRTDPPSAFAGLRANNRINILGWDELELSSEETSGIVQLKAHKKLSKEVIQALHDKTNGWAAGLVLMLEFALTMVQSEHPEIIKWAQRADLLLKKTQDVNLRLQICNYLFIHFMWFGEFANAAMIIDSLPKSAHLPSALKRYQKV